MKYRILNKKPIINIFNVIKFIIFVETILETPNPLIKNLKMKVEEKKKKRLRVNLKTLTYKNSEGETIKKAVRLPHFRKSLYGGLWYRIYGTGVNDVLSVYRHSGIYEVATGYLHLAMEGTLETTQKEFEEAYRDALEKL